MLHMCNVITSLTGVDRYRKVTYFNRGNFFDDLLRAIIYCPCLILPSFVSVFKAEWRQGRIGFLLSCTPCLTIIITVRLILVFPQEVAQHGQLNLESQLTCDNIQTWCTPTDKQIFLCFRKIDAQHYQRCIYWGDNCCLFALCPCALSDSA